MRFQYEVHYRLPNENHVRDECFKNRKGLVEHLAGLEAGTVINSIKRLDNGKLTVLGALSILQDAGYKKC
jgi:hypothetical protein